jgi:hypothetical protein
VLCLDVKRSGRRQKYVCSVLQSPRNSRRNYVQTYGPQASRVQEICLRYVAIYSLTSNHVTKIRICDAQYVHPVCTSSQPWCPVATLYSQTMSGISPTKFSKYFYLNWTQHPEFFGESGGSYIQDLSSPLIRKKTCIFCEYWSRTLLFWYPGLLGKIAI